MTAGAARLASPARGTGTAGPPPAARQAGIVIPFRAARRDGPAGRAACTVPGAPAASGAPAVSAAPAAPGGPARGGGAGRARAATVARARGPRPGRARAAPVVLTRRGRIVVTVFLALAAAGVLLFLARAANAAGAGVSPGGHEQNLSRVAVRSGDTLWSIAVHADPSADPRAVIHRITDLNALAGTAIVPGQVLWVPKD